MVERRTYIPSRGDLVWVNFSPHKGSEQAKKRPAVVISPKIYNTKSSLALLCPVTSQTKGYPFEVPLKSKKVSGVVLSDQVRCIDWKARKVAFIEKAPRHTVTEIQGNIVALVTE